MSGSGLHIHHAVPGIVLLIAASLLAVSPADGTPWREIAAVAIGVGASLVLDEFALILHLDDVYWSQEGRVSVEMVSLASASMGLVLIGGAPFGVDGVEARELGVRLGAIGGMVLNVGLVLVNVFKGKVRLALLAAFMPVVSWIGAIRLARPGSRWARRYDAATLQRASERVARFDARWDPITTRLGNLVAGGCRQPAVLLQSRRIRAMKQLSGMDVTFLNMETPTTFGHVASLNLFDATGPGGENVLETTKQIFLDRIGALEPLRRRLVEVPLGLDLPYWVDDPNFDIDFHVRHHAVPPPGTPQQLSEVISRIHSRPLDRSRPLWELYVIEGIDEGRLFATFTKVHHATVDGAAGAIMLASLLDTAAGTRRRWLRCCGRPSHCRPSSNCIQRTVIEYLKRPEKAIRLTTRAIREARRGLAERWPADPRRASSPSRCRARSASFMRRRIRGVDHEIDNPPHLPYTAAPRTPWNASIGPHRRFAYTTLSLEDAKTIRRELGCTFNDVVMALCSGVLRRYLEKHDALPSESLIAGVPISVRTGDEEDVYQNRVSMLLADLATNEPDPLKRLARVRASMDKAKSSFKAIPAETLQDFTQFAPPAIAARAMRMVSRLKIADRTAPPFNLIISNVPGPAHPLYSGGAQLKHFYPVSICTDGQGLNITVQSYNGSLDFGFIVDRDLVPDVWDPHRPDPRGDGRTPRAHVNSSRSREEDQRRLVRMSSIVAPPDRPQVEPHRALDVDPVTGAEGVDDRRRSPPRTVLRRRTR